MDSSPKDGQLAEDRHVAAVVAFGQPPHDSTLGRLGLRAEVAVALGGDEGRQQGVTEAEQLPEDFPFHGVDPPAVLGGLVHEVPQGVELVSGLEGGLLGCDDHGEVPWVRSHRMCRDRCSAPEGPRFQPPTATTPCQQTKSRRAGGGSRPID